ncbi:hypothetical protein ACP70R_047535 [Stipagrostis hirtigluma subsp. patula]
MYTTAPLSLLRSHTEAAARPPPEGRSSGYLALKSADDDAEGYEAFCGGYATRVWELPFPQNRVLKVQDGDGGEAVLFVPVPDQPLASNRYYAVIATGTHKGLVRACSREEDVVTDCFCRCICDVEPRPFDPADVYQQMEIVQRRRGSFTARAVADDGIPSALYRMCWSVYASNKSKKFDLVEAPGLDAVLRSRQLAGAAPLGDFPAAATTTVGRWHCPFFLIKEGGVVPRQQMGRSAFYEVVLEQRWEPVPEQGHGVLKLASKKAFIGGSVEAKQEPQSPRRGDAYVWFRAAAAAATGQRFGVCTSVWERMLLEVYNGGWVSFGFSGTGVGGTGEKNSVESGCRTSPLQPRPDACHLYARFDLRAAHDEATNEPPTERSLGSISRTNEPSQAIPVSPSSS